LIFCVYFRALLFTLSFFSHTQHNTPQNLCSLWPCGFRDSYREALLCARPRHRVHGVENECSSVDYSSVRGRTASLFIHLFFFSLQFNCCQCDRPKKAIGQKYYPFDNFLKYASSSAKALCRPCSRLFNFAHH